MIATRRRDDPGGRNLPHDQIYKRAPRLERSGMLQLFELQQHPGRVETDVGTIDLDDRCSPYVRGDQRMDRRNARLTVSSIMAVVCSPGHLTRLCAPKEGAGSRSGRHAEHARRA